MENWMVKFSWMRESKDMVVGDRLRAFWRRFVAGRSDGWIVVVFGMTGAREWFFCRVDAMTGVAVQSLLVPVQGQSP